jgi:SNF2 family DNA or RNA helicase
MDLMVWLSSATADLGDPQDMYPQLRFLAPAYMPENYWKFMAQYCITSQYNKHIVTGFKNMDVLRERVALVAIRRQKQDCLDLPAQHIIDVPVKLSQVQRQVYNTLVQSKEMQDALEAMQKGLLSTRGVLSIPNAAILLNKLIQVTCGFVIKKSAEPLPCDTCGHVATCVAAEISPYTRACRSTCEEDHVEPVRIIDRLAHNSKLDELEEKLDEILVEPTNKVIIWGQFIEELNIIEELLRKKGEAEGWSHVRVDGSVTARIANFEAQFNTIPTCRVYLSQVETGVGITLNAANYMIYHSLPWKLGAYLQSLDRNHRIGQERDVTVFRLLGTGTIDRDIAKSLDTKFTVSETILGTLKCLGCGSSEECERNGITLYSDECRYKGDRARPIAKPKEIT